MGATILQFKKAMKTKPPLKAKHIPVSEEMLYSVRDQLQSEMKAGFNDMKAFIKEITDKLDAEIRMVRNETAAIEAKLDSRTAAIEAKLDKSTAILESKIHYQTVLIEQQAVENRYVLDGYDSIYKRQGDVEIKIDDMAQTLSDLKKFNKDT